MNIDEFLESHRRSNYSARHIQKRQEWWPSPKIVFVDEEWGYKCYSFSTIGFHPTDPPIEGTPSGECKSFGKSPIEAYDSWCEVFESWNKKEEWVKCGHSK